MAGSENSEDGSGYGSPTLPTATVIPSPAVTPASYTTLGSTQPVLVSTRPTEGSSEAESVPTTELRDMSNNESLETEEPSVLVYAVPAVLLALLIFLVIAFIVVHKRKKSKQGKFLFLFIRRISLEYHSQNAISRTGMPHLGCSSLVLAPCLPSRKGARRLTQQSLSESWCCCSGSSQFPYGEGMWLCHAVLVLGNPMQGDFSAPPACTADRVRLLGAAIKQEFLRAEAFQSLQEPLEGKLLV